MPVYNAPNSILETLTQAQRDNFLLMADTDVRTILQRLEAAASGQIAQAERIDDTRSLLAKVRNATTINKKVVLEQADFVLVAGVWTAQCLHGLDDERPSVTIYDNSGDQQIIQFVATTYESGIVELTSSQYSDNTYPLVVSFYGQAQGAYSYKEGDSASMPGWNASFKVYFSYLNRFGWSGFEGNYQQNPAIHQAFLTPYDFFVYTYQDDDIFAKIDGRNHLASYVVITKEEYETKRLQPGVIIL